jgi:hypothetical protein
VRDLDFPLYLSDGFLTIMMWYSFGSSLISQGLKEEILLINCNLALNMPNPLKHIPLHQRIYWID